MIRLQIETKSSTARDGFDNDLKGVPCNRVTGAVEYLSSESVLLQTTHKCIHATDIKPIFAIAQP